MTIQFAVAVAMLLAIVVIVVALQTVLSRSQPSIHGDDEDVAVLAEQQKPAEEAGTEERASGKLEDPVKGLLVHNVPDNMTAKEVYVISANVAREAITELYEEIIGEGKQKQEHITVGSFVEIELKPDKKKDKFRILGNRGAPTYLYDPLDPATKKNIASWYWTVEPLEIGDAGLAIWVYPVVNNQKQRRGRRKISIPIKVRRNYRIILREAALATGGALVGWVLNLIAGG